ncbi:bifunctional UDP-N-acetylglucosamine diphosphorylase/glucosamine-1-phosphate N-acetyltransferase GlmU [Candidatus Babeliales bacterium]|nr:bifunctional UDP-N-acetylglucosamine diphosphorylase/glucosamine-1-phosphate N-acetyltransferase GlmU [Candidatus Babeliales bacterium]
MENTRINWNAQAIVLAAGQASRFKTKKTKMLFNICGRSMILYPLKVLEDLNLPMTLVLGYQAQEVRNEIEKAGIAKTQFVIQTEQKGTGHAVACSEETWDQEDILILYGDTPLVPKELIRNLLIEHQESKAIISFCSTLVLDPAGYGRVIGYNDGAVRIIEDKDCTEEQRALNRINAGIYVIKKSFLKENIHHIKPSTTSGEIYFTDLINMASDQGLPVHVVNVPYDNVRGINTLQELWSVEQIKRSEFIKHWMLQGVRFELAQSIHIDIDVEIGAGSFIGTGVHLLGKTKLGEENTIGAFSIVENTTTQDDVHIHSHSVVQDSIIENGAHVGPFARLRNNVVIGAHAEIGNFVEIKQTTIGAHTKMKHLAYLGNATVGQNVNIGAGTVLCNYDGEQKHPTVIEDNAFVGSNNTLVAPITIGKDSYTAAGSTITNDVAQDSLAIGRSKQVNKEGYAKKMREKLQKKTSCANDKKALNFLGAVKTTNTEHNEL